MQPVALEHQEARGLGDRNKSTQQRTKAKASTCAAEKRRPEREPAEPTR